MVMICVLIAKVLRAESRGRDLTMNLKTANIKLTELDRMKSEFLSFASHQIKAPMSVVKGYATLIVDGSFGQVSSQVTEVAQKIKDSADRMIGLVNTFLDLRRLEEGRITYEFQDMELGTLVTSVIEELQPLAVRKNLRLTLELGRKTFRVHADGQRLRQVIQNLVENATKYTDAGSIAVTLTEGGTGMARITVTDTGRGISAELLPRLFEQFSRDQSIAKEIAGTGLGLYIAREMMIAHHGRVWASSPGTGKGSTFVVEIPVI
jgi:signal transduction histidine kinase